MRDNKDMWIPIPLPGFPDYQWCEAIGAVRSLRSRHGPRAVPMVMRHRITKKGYQRWGLWDIFGKQRTVHLHQLVCTQHHGPRPNGMQVCHGDGNPANNSPENLRWGTPADNINDKTLHGTSARGEAHGLAKLTTQDVQNILRISGRTQKSLAKEFGVSQAVISSILTGKHWKHVSDIKRAA